LYRYFKSIFLLSLWLKVNGVESFQDTSFALPFLPDQFNGSIIGVVHQLYDDAPIVGCTVPSFGYTDSLSGETVNADPTPTPASTLQTAVSDVELGMIEAPAASIGSVGQSALMDRQVTQL
jgi:hypothetical protein